MPQNLSSSAGRAPATRPRMDHEPAQFRSSLSGFPRRHAPFPPHVAPQNFDHIKGVSELVVAKTHVKRPQLATKFDFQAVMAEICLEVGTIVIEVKMGSNTEYGLLPTRYAGVFLCPSTHPRSARA